MAMIAPWAHDRYGNSTDPITLVFDRATADEIDRDMRTKLHGWGTPSPSDDLYIHVGDAEVQQDRQLAHSIFSLANAFRWISRIQSPHPFSMYRVHVRFWNVDAGNLLWRFGLAPEHYDVIAGAHVEPSLWFHNPESFE